MEESTEGGGLNYLEAQTWRCDELSARSSILVEVYGAGVVVSAATLVGLLGQPAGCRLPV